MLQRSKPECSFKRPDLPCECRRHTDLPMSIGHVQRGVSESHDIQQQQPRDRSQIHRSHHGSIHCKRPGKRRRQPLAWPAADVAMFAGATDRCTTWPPLLTLYTVVASCQLQCLESSTQDTNKFLPTITQYYTPGGVSKDFAKYGRSFQVVDAYWIKVLMVRSDDNFTVIDTKPSVFPFQI